MALLDRQFYRPHARTVLDPAANGLTPEHVRFTSADGIHLDGLWFPASGAARATVVHCHGNAGNVTGHFPHSAWLTRHGFDVFCFDYRGYGASAGRASRAGTIADAHAAVDLACKRAPAQAVLLFGQSLGGAVAIVVAAQRDDLAGVAVDGAFSSYRAEVAWVCRHMPGLALASGWIARWGVSAGQDPIDYVDRIAPTPLFLFHGELDRTCPVWMAQELYARADEPRELWCVPGMDHDEALHLMKAVARPRLVRFYDACLQRSPASTLAQG